MMTLPEVLRIDHVKKPVGNFVLEAHFEVRPAERAALVGRSGSGKTSLLRMIAGLDRAAGNGCSGRVLLGEDDMTHWPAERRNIGMVFQDAALFSARNVLENAVFGLKMRGVGREEREAEARRWLAKVGLQGRERSPVSELSGGEKQRVALVRALIWKPRCLLLDEPFSALDGALKADLRQELIELHRMWPVPLVLVTHDEADLDAIAPVRLKIDESEGGARRSVIRA